MKNRNSLIAVLALLLAVVIIGCGGGGGAGGGGNGGGNNGGGGSSPLAGRYIEIVDNTGTVVDPFSLSVGQNLRVVLASYDGQGGRFLLNFNNYTCSASPADVATDSGGRMQIIRKPSGFWRVTVDYSVFGKVVTYVLDCSVPQTNTTISGKVEKFADGVGVKYVEVGFYDASGSMIAGARTGDGGVFKAYAPSNVARVSVVAESVNTTYFFRTFEYGTKIFTMDPAACPVKISGVQAGHDNPLAHSFGLFLQADGPPPPPDGCTSN